MQINVLDDHLLVFVSLLLVQVIFIGHELNYVDLLLIHLDFATILKVLLKFYINYMYF
jgi:hypothetical protein